MPYSRAQLFTQLLIIRASYSQRLCIGFVIVGRTNPVELYCTCSPPPSPGAGLRVERPDAALAQSLFGTDTRYYYDPVDLAAMRIVTISLSVGAGFALGWFLSPLAKELRRMIFLIGSAVVVLLAIFNQGILGWGAFSIVSFLGFWLALGSWVGRGVGEDEMVALFQRMAASSHHIVSTLRGLIAAILSKMDHTKGVYRHPFEPTRRTWRCPLTQTLSTQ